MEQIEFCDRLLAWWERNKRKFPWRETDDPYGILVSEILLHRTRATQVEAVYSHLMTRYPTVKELAAADSSALKRQLHSLGLFWRTKLLMSAAQIIDSDLNGLIPSDKEQLKMLPGVSDYIASAISCFAYLHPEVLLDVNTVRVIGRVFGVKVTDNSRRSRRFVNLYKSLLDREHPREFNYAMIDLGALVCTAKNPRCPECPLSGMCSYAMTQSGGGG